MWHGKVLMMWLDKDGQVMSSPPASLPAMIDAALNLPPGYVPMVIAALEDTGLPQTPVSGNDTPRSSIS